MGPADVLQVGGYVLAGGKSSRMGRDKALLPLAGKPLIARAVAKLGRVCADVHILSGDPALEAFARLLPDVHPGCGPVGGMEAALLHSPYEWSVFLPVDMPFLPARFLNEWVEAMLATEDGARIRMFTAEGRAQPGFCLLHRDVAPFLTAAILRGEYKLMVAFEAAGRELAVRHGLTPGAGLWKMAAGEFLTGLAGSDAGSEQAVWFANLNTLEDFSRAEEHAAALDL